MKPRRLIPEVVCAASVGVLVGGFLLLTPRARAVERRPDGWSPPDLDRYSLVRSLPLDLEGEEDSPRTHPVIVQVYIHADGHAVYAYVYRNYTFAYAVIAGDNPATHYAIRDSRCRGVFDEKYAPHEEMSVPRCLLERTGPLLKIRRSPAPLPLWAPRDGTRQVTEPPARHKGTTLSRSDGSSIAIGILPPTPSSNF